MNVAVRVHRAEWQRGHQYGVLFGRAGGRDVYVLDDVLWIIDMQERLTAAGGPVDAVFPEHQVAELPR